MSKHKHKHKTVAKLAAEARAKLDKAAHEIMKKSDGTLTFLEAYEISCEKNTALLKQSLLDLQHPDEKGA